MLVLALVACAPREPAPEDLDGLFHWFLANYETASDEEILAAAANLEPLISDPSRGLVTAITPEEQATTGVEHGEDPAEATGIFVAGPVACDFGDYERVHYALDQEGLYETATGDDNKYVAYDRVYTSDLDAYESRETPYLTWDTTYTAKPVLTEYTALIKGGMRYVPGDDTRGPVVLNRAILPNHATFEVETSDYFEQDYQLDILLPAGEGSIHGYAVWRDLSSATLTDESAGVQTLLLDGFEDYDRETELVCAAGGF
jgi:hypothetical protein